MSSAKVNLNRICYPADMSQGETKQWMTAKRLERGPAAAEAELRRWAKDAATRAGFRPVHISGNATALRADALASRQRHMGSRLVARKVHEQVSSNAGIIVFGLLAIGGGYFAGRWFKAKREHDQLAHATSNAIHGSDESESKYLVGALVLGAW